jgi:hypothetical protein
MRISFSELMFLSSHKIHYLVYLCTAEKESKDYEAYINTRLKCFSLLVSKNCDSFWSLIFQNVTSSISVANFLVIRYRMIELATETEIDLF